MVIDTATAGSEDALVVLAVDPQNADPNELRELFNALSAWKSTSNLEVVPVAVLRGATSHVQGEILDRLRRDLSIAINRICEECMGAAFSEALRGPVILVEHSSSLRHAARAVYQTARALGAGFIVARTHGTRGLYQLGSFSELLIAISDIPVFLASPRAKIPGRIRRILFATDLSQESHVVYKKVLDWARQPLAKEAEILVFHKLEQFQQVVVLGAFGPVFEASGMDDLYLTSKAEQTATGDGWASEARELGVNARFILDTMDSGVADAILNEAEALSVDIIAMATYRGPIAQAVLGSAARDVLIRSERPVLIMHPK